MLSFPSLEHLLVVQQRWDSGVQGVGSRPEQFALIPGGAAPPGGQTEPPTSTAGTATAFKRFLEPFPGMRDGREGGEQQGELLNAAGEAAQGRGCGEVG